MFLSVALNYVIIIYALIPNSAHHKTSFVYYSKKKPFFIFLLHLRVSTSFLCIGHWKHGDLNVSEGSVYCIKQFTGKIHHRICIFYIYHLFSMFFHHQYSDQYLVSPSQTQNLRRSLSPSALYFFILEHCMHTIYNNGRAK